MLLMLLSCLGILRGKNFSIHLLNDGLRYFQMIGLIEGQHIHKYKITEVFSTEINCSVDSQGQGVTHGEPHRVLLAHMT